MALPNTESTDSYLTLSPLYFYVYITSIHIRLGGLYCVCMWWIDYNCIDLDQLILRACTIPWALVTSMLNPCILLPPEGLWVCVLMANREPHMDMAETCLCKLYTQLPIFRLGMIKQENVLMLLGNRWDHTLPTDVSDHLHNSLDSGLQAWVAMKVIHSRPHWH